MLLIPLLGRTLKSDEVIELLELWDIDVTYNFDRLHENTPDRYDACCPEFGLELVFDDQQYLRTIFLYYRGDEKRNAFDFSNCDVMTFGSPEQVKAFAEESNRTITTGSSALFGKAVDWSRVEFESHSAHYQFDKDGLSLVSLSAL